MADFHLPDFHLAGFQVAMLLGPANESLDQTPRKSIADMDAVLGDGFGPLVAAVSAIAWSMKWHHEGPVQWRKAQLAAVVVRAQAVAGAVFAAKAWSFQASQSSQIWAARPVLASAGKAVARSTGAHVVVLSATPWNRPSPSTMSQQRAAQPQTGPPYCRD